MTLTLSTEARTDLGRRAKVVRRAGRIPAVIYGHGVEPMAVSIAASDFLKTYRAAGMSSIIDVELGGKPVKALIQEVQVHPVTMQPQHVDFRQIKMDEELEVEVPVSFIGEAPAVKELQGTLVRPLETLTVSCLPTDLPHELEVDLSSLKTFDDTITVADLKLPKGVKVLQAPDEMVATVSAPISEEELKKMEESAQVDVTAIKTEAEEKREAEEAAKAAEETGESA